MPVPDPYVHLAQSPNLSSATQRLISYTCKCYMWPCHVRNDVETNRIVWQLTRGNTNLFYFISNCLGHTRLWGQDVSEESSPEKVLLSTSTNFVTEKTILNVFASE